MQTSSVELTEEQAKAQFIEMAKYFRFLGRKGRRAEARVLARKSGEKYLDVLAQMNEIVEKLEAMEADGLV